MKSAPGHFKKATLMGFVVVLVLSTVVLTVFAADNSFFTNFETALDSHLADPSNAFAVADGVISKTASADLSDFAFIRTVANNYDTGDWIYELDIDLDDEVGEIVYVGIGSGEGSELYGQPVSSAALKLHSAEFLLQPAGIWGNGAKVEVVVTQESGSTVFYKKIGTLTDNGLHRVRIQREGPQLTFSILDRLQGTSLMTERIALPSVVDSPDAALFFGNLRAGSSYDNMRVEFFPYPPQVLALQVTKEECQANWAAYEIFKNQGDCVSFVTTEKKNLRAYQQPQVPSRISRHR